MPDRTRRRRATRAILHGRARSLAVSKRLGIALRDARAAAGLTQQGLGAEAGLSQAWVSRMERGVATSASLESWCAVAAVLGLQLVSFLESIPGPSRPVDIEHLRRQDLVLRSAAPGGWIGRPEVGVRVPNGRSRSIDLLLVRERTREAMVTEIWDLLLDLGEALRGMDLKVDAIRHTLGPGWRVRGLWVVRATRRNRALLAQLSALVDARFPSRSHDWLLCISNSDRPMPDGDGLLWSDAKSARLFARR